MLWRLTYCLTLLLLLSAAWAASRAVYFVGIDGERANTVAIYRGLPYELPLGIEMYSEKDVTNVPAAAITDRRQRNYVLDHHPRGRDDSVDLLDQIESNYDRP